MGLARTLLLSAAVVTISSSVFAQTNPRTVKANPSVPPDATVVSPRWNQNSVQNTYDAPLAGPDDLVTRTVTAIPQARADATVARWTFSRINQDLNLASNFLLRDFRDSNDYATAMEEFQAAYSAYETARSNALASLRADDKYRAVESIRKDVSDQIADEHDQKEPSRDRLVSLAGLKIDTIAGFRDQERDMLAADTNVANARDRLLAAGKSLARLERNFARQARDNDILVELRRNRADARIAMLASAAYLQESRFARNIALRYAAYARGYDRYVPRLYDTGYQYGGYGNYRYRGGAPIVYTPGFN